MNIFQEGAKDEGNLHRLLMSKILTSFGRTPASRPAKISMSQCTGMNQQTIVILIIYQIEFTLLQEEGQNNMAKLKKMVSMIYKDLYYLNSS